MKCHVLRSFEVGFFLSLKLTIWRLCFLIHKEVTNETFYQRTCMQCLLRLSTLHELKYILISKSLPIGICMYNVPS